MIIVLSASSYLLCPLDLDNHDLQVGGLDLVISSKNEEGHNRNRTEHYGRLEIIWRSVSKFGMAFNTTMNCSFFGVPVFDVPVHFAHTF